MNTWLKKIQAPARQVWRALAAHQNHGFFAPCAQQQVPSQGDSWTRLPAGLDLRASGPGFHNQPVQLSIAPTGEATLQLGESTLSLGTLAAQQVETGWMVTGLRLRGAVRVAQKGVVLLVPDREDVPYLLRVLAPRAATPASALRPALAA